MKLSETALARILWLVVGVAVAAAGVQYLGVKGRNRSAFNRWRPQLFALERGEDIYRKFAFPTPPIMAAVLLPFAKLPPPMGMAAWFACKAALTMVAAGWLARSFAGPRPPPWLVPAGLLAALPPILGDLQHGNVNLWILFLLAGAWTLHRSGRDFRAGLTTALAVACKVTPALLAAYFLWRGRWRAAAGVAAGLALWLVAVPGTIFGPARNLELLASWRDAMLKPFVARGEIEANEVNQSVPALVSRLLAPVVRPEWAKEPPVQVNIVAWPAAKVRAAAFAAVAAVAGSWLLATRIGSPDAHFCLTLLAMLALSERSWKHHYVIALPAFLYVLANARGWRWMFPLLAAGLLLASSKDLVGSAASDGLQARGVYLWAAALLAVGCGGRRGFHPMPIR